MICSILSNFVFRILLISIFACMMAACDGGDVGPPGQGDTIVHEWNSSIFTLSKKIESDDELKFPQVVDFDNDGLTDVIAYKEATKEIVLFKNTNSPQFTERSLLTDVSVGAILDAADYNQDGFLDFVAVDDKNILTLYLNDGKGQLESLTLDESVDRTVNTLSAIFGDSAYVFSSDMNDDQYPDLIISQQSALYLLINQEGSQFEKIKIRDIENLSTLKAYDLNKDGLNDLIFADFSHPDIYFLEQNIDGSFSESVIAKDIRFPTSFDIYDYDGDGDNDIFIHKLIISSSLVLLVNNGDNSFVSQSIDFDFSSIKNIVIEDVNGDSVEDWVFSNVSNQDAQRGDNGIYIRYSNGDGTFMAAQKILNREPSKILRSNMDDVSDRELVSIDRKMIEIFGLSKTIYLREGQALKLLDKRFDSHENVSTVILAEEDYQFFDYDDSDHSLNFSQAQSFGEPKDKNKNNRYEVIVQTNDGVLTRNQRVTVHIYVDDDDDDNDGFPDDMDDLPLNPTGRFDTDGDGISNSFDLDDDGDNSPDIEDNAPLDSKSHRAPTWESFEQITKLAIIEGGRKELTLLASDPDNNPIQYEIVDNVDEQIFLVDSISSKLIVNKPIFTADNVGSQSVDYSITVSASDGYSAVERVFVVTVLKDDGDSDNDGVPDSEDAFPADDKEWLDTDKDLIGNNRDPDDDNDGREDSKDNAPLDKSSYSAPLWWAYDGNKVNAIKPTHIKRSVSVVGDFNGDGYTDMVGKFGNVVSIMINNKEGGFIHNYTDSIPSFLGRNSLVLDIDNNGRLDIVGFDQLEGLFVFSQDAELQFSKIKLHDNNGGSLAAADFDGDGFSDIAYIFKSTVIIYSNNGDNTFTSKLTNSGVYVDNIVAHDYDNDLDSDLLFVSYPKNEIGVLENDGASGFSLKSLTYVAPKDSQRNMSQFSATYPWIQKVSESTYTQLTAFPQRSNVDNDGVAIIDIDGDGDLDSIGRKSNGFSSDLIVSENIGDQFFNARKIYEVVENKPFSNTDFIDMNNDGHLDIITYVKTEPYSIWIDTAIYFEISELPGWSTQLIAMDEDGNQVEFSFKPGLDEQYFDLSELGKLSVKPGPVSENKTMYRLDVFASDNHSKSLRRINVVVAP